MKRINFVIDMLEGFTNQGPLSSALIQNIVPIIAKYLTEHESEDNLFICDSHDKDDIEMKQYPYHCLANTKEAEIDSKLEKFAKNKLLKHSTNAFHNLNKNILKNYDEYVIIGCCSDICVLQFALTLKTYLNELKIDKDVVVFENLIATFDALNHDAQTYHEYALNLLKAAGIIIKKY